MSSVPSFPEFFAACHRGRSPFPWQRRLAERVVAGVWPEAVAIPTGLGKTACIDIAVWALAAQATKARIERKAATRIWYVVNRRLLVDVAFEHGKKLARWLADPERLREDWPDASGRHVEALALVGEALRGIAAFGREGVPLHVARLRGAAELGVRAPDPSQPSLIFATVPMFASRWLFRGYGTSVSMRPVDAALAGIDSLVLLDEAHLARPLVRLRRQVEECDPGQPGLLLPEPRRYPRFVSLTATGEPVEDTFGLSEEDLAHPVVTRRLEASKPTTLVPSSTKDLVADLADAAISVLGRSQQPTSCVVFVNTPRRAREVYGRIQRDLARRELNVSMLLLTGRMREREAARVRNTLLDPTRGCPSGRDRARARQEHLLVVATQTLEVGADLDFDHLVTESAGVRALVQRLGRLNRLGDAEAATATIVHAQDAESWPVYGDEPSVVWKRLSDVEGDLDLGPGGVTEVLGEPSDAPPPAGELLRCHLWDWAKTSRQRAPLADPELFFSGFDDDVARVSVVWRAYVPHSGDQLLPTLSGDEAIEIPIGEVRKVLGERNTDTVTRLGPDRVSVEAVPVSRLHPGDQVILPVSFGGYDRFGWNPEATDRVADLSMLRFGLVLTEPVCEALFSPQDAAELSDSLEWFRVEGFPDEELEDIEAKRSEALIRLADAIANSSPPDSWSEAERTEWREWRDALVTRIAGNGLKAVEQVGSVFAVTVRLARTRQPRIVADVLDALSFTDDPQSLDGHHELVSSTARRIAERLSFPTQVIDPVARAGALHDLGKLDPRFQRWLDPAGESDVPRAKSSTARASLEATRIRSGWPRGGRHELLSARLVAAATGRHDMDADLIIHLVGSHHGHGRPDFKVVDDPYPTPIRADVSGVEVQVDGAVSVPDWTQPARFRKLCETYGYWGLALLESVVRQADHLASGAGGVV